MGNIAKRIIGILLTILAAASLVLTLFGILRLWQIKPPVEEQLLKVVTTISETIETTSQALIVLDTSFGTFGNNLTSLQSILLEAAQSVHHINPLLEAIQTLTSENLPQTITTTQTSLASAQRSASLIETVLVGVSKIPFFPGGPYQPDVPLEQSLAQISENLDEIKKPLEQISKELDTNQLDLVELEQAITQTMFDVEEIQTSLIEANQLLKKYQDQTVFIQDKLAALETKIPLWLNDLVWILTLVGIWLLITQVHLLILGLHWTTIR